MIETPQIVQSQALQTAVIHLVVPREEIQQVMGPAINEILQVIGAQGITPCGPLFTYHHQIPGAVFDFDVGIPVFRPVKATGRVKPGQLVSVKVARTVYQGGYEGLGAAWGEFDAWLKANGHVSGPTLWEFYVKGPESGPNPSIWKTELNRPLMG